MTAVLSLSDVTLLHGDGEETVTALDHVDLEVAAGELVAVVGPSGAGKSSLLAVAGALTRPTSGAVRLGDVDLTTASARDLTRTRRERIGFVFQSGNLIPALTSVDQLRLPLTFGPVRDPRDPHELLAAVGMEHKANRRPHQLSGGERQRVGIARALVTRPQVLLVDEPTAALDRQRSQEVLGLLASETHEHGVATIVVTHDHDVLHHCDRVLEMIDGRLGQVSLTAP
ncbi:ATP-binding cassette domain-containing protein [Nocardioides sp. dk4132]|uniref:ABC transporter ATP-binding protein n=1 Tax=unclassified Nocardioides TaxID=2615069 RepID=UPI0012966C0B|nr:MULTISPECIES: ABC transporter ATP-binding protein [unclassified Nocardioides]MQW75222.1 ATP-binding cassette domain-containing protein [Nocardioides sp. dk4132]QGA07625.1 ATP-binding cassette domain-containing protein [Nocardioides sp. dk884]